MRRSSFTACSVMAAVLTGAAWQLALAQSAGGVRPGGQSATPNACALVSPAEIAKLTGRAELAKAKPVPSDEDQSGPGQLVEAGGTGCSYPGSGTSLTLEVQRLTSVEKFQASAAGRVKAGEFQPHAGLGDAAWFRDLKALQQHGYVVRVGSYMLIVMMGTKEAGSPEKVKAQVLPVAHAAAAKLR